MKIISYSDCSELCALEDAWNRLARQGLFFIPSFSELRIQLAASKSKFKLLAAVDNSQIVAIACFIYGNAIKSYQIGGKKLFNLPIRVVNLFGSCVVGEPDEHIIQNFFHVILEERGFDLINLGQIFVESPLYRAASRLRGTVAWRGARKEKLWWLITLPNSFDDYIASLRETTRHHITRDCRRFERACSQFRLITAPQEVDTFLQEAEKISRRTYQWHFLCGIRNDEATRQHLIRLAESGRLRCYLSYLGDRPCAFGWGELVHKRFSFQQTGYDPKHRKLSPGTALMMRMIRDLIETTDCEVF